jgi:MFS family permease
MTEHYTTGLRWPEPMPADPREALARRFYYGWVVVVACFLASVTVFGTTYAFGVFYDVFIEAFAASRSRVALVFGVQSGLLYVSGVGAGRLVDRHGQRRVAAASGAVLVAGLVWTAFARSFAELLAAYGVVAAVGMAGLYIVSYATLPAWFERRRGTATGVASAGLGVGLLVVPPGADAVIAAFGWRRAILAVAGLVALLSFAVAVLFADRPSDVGADRSAEFEVAPTAGEGDGDEAVDLGATVASGRFLLVFAGWTLVFAPLYVVLSHVVLHASSAGLGRGTGVLAIAVVGVTTTVARVGVGTLSDRLGRPRTFVACGTLLGSATVALAAARTVEAFLGVVAVFGVGYGGCGGLIGAVTADLFGNRALNTVFALLSVSFAVAGLAAPPLAGLWFETAGSYDLAFVAAGLLGVAGAGCVGLAARADAGSGVAA